MSLTPLQYLYSVHRLIFRIVFTWADLTVAWSTWLFSSSGLCMPAGRRETNMAIILCVLVLWHSLRSPHPSPLEGFSYFLSPSWRLSTFSPSLTGLWSVTPWHEETCLARRRGKWGGSSIRWMVRGRTWGEKAPIGRQVIRRSSLEDAVKEVLQVRRVGWTWGRLRGRPESYKRKDETLFVLWSQLIWSLTFFFYEC